MKKFKNNALWGIISMGLNLVILILVIVSAVQLGTYDKKNTYLQDSIRPTYSYWTDSVNYSKSVLDKKDKALEGYKNSYRDVEASSERVKAALAETPDDKDLQNKYYSDTTNMKNCKENIERLTEEIKCYKDTLSFAETGLKPWSDKYTAAINDAAPSLKNFNIVVIIAAILLALKFLCFGIWMMLNVKNIRKICPWWNKSSEWMSVVSWFIPVYDLVKPCKLFSELISETKGVLHDKSIITDKKDANHMESISLWWGSMLFSKILVPLLIGGVTICFYLWLLPFLGTAGIDADANSLGMFNFGAYFGNTGMFFYLRPHVILMVMYIVGWLVYLGYECYMIFSYNKLNKMLCDNEDKFDVKETAENK